MPLGSPGRFPALRTRWQWQQARPCRPTMSPCRRIVPLQWSIFIYFPPPYLAHCSRRRLLSFVAFLTSRKCLKWRGGCRRWCGCSPFPPELPTDVCRQPMRPLNPRKPAAAIGFLGQLTVEFPVCSCGHFAHVHCWSPGLEPSYVNIIHLDACVDTHLGIFRKSVHCIACNSPRDGSSSPVSFRTPRHPAAYLWRGREGWRGRNNNIKLLLIMYIYFIII